MTDTMVRVSPNPKRLLSDEDAARIRAARVAQDEAYSEYQAAVIDALLNGASVRTVAEFTGLSTTTIQRWKADAGPRPAAEREGAASTASQ